MFNTSPTCSLCKQRIALIDDAVLDHDVQYWRGGKTVPDNARLTHRLCNLKKG
ncbi:MAG TPA: HNH endonuclease [Candidatus Krumholzibacteria bacterium]